MAVELLFLIAMGALVAVSRRYADLHLGIPGHTGLLWMFLLVAARAAVRRDGAGVIVGGSAALWGEAVGLKHSLPYNLALYMIPGLTLDLGIRFLRTNLRHPLIALAAGATAHATKFFYILGIALVAGQTKRFTLYGELESFATHIMFGAAGGLLAAIAFMVASRRGPLGGR